jgi:hypothetical protein
LIWAALDAGAQQTPKSDEELIANALSAAPAAVAQQAAVMAMDAQGQMRTLRAGSNKFTCMPDNPNSPGDDPMCLDQNGMEWAHAWMTKTAPPAGKVGFGYMLQGGTTPSNVDPFATQPPDGMHWMQEPPHEMIFNYGEAIQDYPKPGEMPDMTQPWVMWAGTPYEHLMLPVK